MGRLRRPLTEIEQARHCALCGAWPGERCTNPGGSNYAAGVHSPRKYAAPTRPPAAPPTQREQVSAYFRMLNKLAETAEEERLEDLFNRIERTIAFAEYLHALEEVPGPGADAMDGIIEGLRRRP